MSFVVDASMALAWHYPDESNARSAHTFARAEAEVLVVPEFWQVEVANVLLSNERRKRSNLVESSDFIAVLATLAIDVDRDGSARAFARVLPLARAHGLTVYDALYLELAERRGLPLATFDGDLADAARSIGIEIY